MSQVNIPYGENSLGFEVKVIADSIYQESRLTTLQLRYPRFIHAEFMTHRVFSRNASSSRAIPVEKMIKQVREEPATFVEWGKNQPGMQAKELLEGPALAAAQDLWTSAAKSMAEYAEHMNRWGVHKQIANRLLEPFQFMSVIMTSSDFDNFFNLRDHKDAQPEIQALAKLMKATMAVSDPDQRSVKRPYHLPYIQAHEWAEYSIEDLTKFSVARCARVSYLTHDGEKPTPEKDIELYARLVGGQPLHASPAEHQARINSAGLYDIHGNFHRNWIQYRKLLEKDFTAVFFFDRPKFVPKEKS